MRLSPLHGVNHLRDIHRSDHLPGHIKTEFVTRAVEQYSVVVETVDEHACSILVAIAVQVGNPRFFSKGQVSMTSMDNSGVVQSSF